MFRLVSRLRTVTLLTGLVRTMSGLKYLLITLRLFVDWGCPKFEVKRSLDAS
jgi:hypothetical protein